MEVHELCITHMYTLITRRVLGFPGQETPEQNEEALQQRMEQIGQQIAEKLDKFVLYLGDAGRFTGQPEPPIFAVWRLWHRSCIRQVKQREHGYPPHPIEGELW